MREVPVYSGLSHYSHVESGVKWDVINGHVARFARVLSDSSNLIVRAQARSVVRVDWHCHNWLRI